MGRQARCDGICPHDQSEKKALHIGHWSRRVLCNQLADLLKISFKLLFYIFFKGCPDNCRLLEQRTKKPRRVPRTAGSRKRRIQQQDRNRPPERPGTLSQLGPALVRLSPPRLCADRERVQRRHGQLAAEHPKIRVASNASFIFRLVNDAQGRIISHSNVRVLGRHKTLRSGNRAEMPPVLPIQPFAKAPVTCRGHFLAQ